MVKKGWKLVKAGFWYGGRGVLYSVTCHPDSPSTVWYQEGEWVGRRDNCGPLTVFRTRKDARAFRKKCHLKGTWLFKCLYEPSEGKTLYSPLMHTNLVMRYKPIETLPTGSDLAERVFLVERAR